MIKMKKLVRKIKISTSISLITGLHIGGSKENVEIGGIDNPVIKIPTKDGQPYIPGSSLKGKIRCLLEQIYGSPTVGGNSNINKLFGYSETKQISKLIVRDSYLSENSVELLKKSNNMDMPYTEGKWENVIDRINGTADSPRQMERIPAGVSFDVEFILNIWDDDNQKEFLELLEKGILALENDYLGGSGTRGYGQVKFSKRIITDIPLNQN